ncbi:hypothetical protein N6H18_18085 [Reichenbachiella agarivorans]|uniref:Uncharacterized protein n=1 Tax=Reichenbachiella agarivorans TaxID=2979464 RepID=A0ABY6CP08_9BACT|nr:hypothetical protein [Reichenbachiella agarivorans]UXP32251.1 hypothetical protein N6H18_18085 [Reichenbachiella agarivorans]
MSIIFPRPFAIAIDDLGWLKGYDEGEEGYGPYRLGIDRLTTIADYEAVIDLAKKAGVRLQGLFILGEMDRENFLGDYPTTTHFRENWDNSENISDLQLEMMEYVKHHGAHLEFGLHGIGHEFWPKEGTRRRAEWYNTDDDHPWPEEEIRKHVECFVRIMKQYGISKEEGHSFPESFVPCAYSYYWNPNGTYSLGSVLGEYGIRFANTDFTQIPECNPPKEDNGGGFDHKVHVMNRYNYGNLWCAEAKLPDTPLADQPTDYIETHWPNLLYSKEESQQDVTAKWVDYYQSVQKDSSRYCAKNTEQMHSQWLYKKYTKITEKKPNTVHIDNTEMPDEVYANLSPSNMVLKIQLSEGQHISSATLDGKCIPAYFEDQGYAFLYLPPLLQKKYELKYELGVTQISQIVWHDNTSNILDTSCTKEETRVKLRWYGRQTLRILNVKTPVEISSNNQKLKILDWKVEGEYLNIDLEAHDIQGETGTIQIKY